MKPTGLNEKWFSEVAFGDWEQTKGGRKKRNFSKQAAYVQKTEFLGLKIERYSIIDLSFYSYLCLLLPRSAGGRAFFRRL